MDFLMAPLEAVRDFLELGGDVLTLIALTIFGMWALIVERLMFFRSELRKLGIDIRERWEARAERKSWHAHQIRESMISQFSMEAGISILPGR